MTLRVGLAGIGAWSAGFGGWPALRRALVEGPAAVGEASPPLRRPVPLLLPAAERRRVPDGVAVALEVAREAIESAAPGTVDSASLASVFASAHGELAIVDYLCTTLASDPTLLSPIRFHHSVHNAAAGYWSIATPSFGPATALAAGDETFALGLLEAATQVVAEARPVLFVAFDTPGVGLLARAAPNTALFGAALLLSPIEGASSTPQLAIAIESRASGSPSMRAESFQTLAPSSPAALALTLLEALAGAVPATIDYPLSAESTLRVNVVPNQESDLADRPHPSRKLDALPGSDSGPVRESPACPIPPLHPPSTTS